jgi:hypothetical protein
MVGRIPALLFWACFFVFAYTIERRRWGQVLYLHVELSILSFTFEALVI